MSAALVPPALHPELLACRDRHRAGAGARVGDFVRRVQRAYAAEVDAFVAAHLDPAALRGVLGPYAEGTRAYLRWMVWVGWNVAELAPPLERDTDSCARQLALATAAYAAGRLIDDGLDDHEEYKGRYRTVVGVFRQARPAEPAHAACASSALVGCTLLQHALRGLRRLGHARAADAVDRLVTVACTGVLAESAVGARVDAATYREIVRRKSVAYNMILYKPVLAGTDEGLRVRLLRLLGSLDEAAQLVNDLGDRDEDLARGQMNALAEGVHTPESLRATVAATVTGIWAEAETLPPGVRDALACMLLNLEGEPAAGGGEPCASSC